MTSADEFARVVIRTNPDGSILRLGDVARIELGAANLDRETRLNGKPATLVGLYQALGTNAGRAGTGMNGAKLKRLYGLLKSLVTPKMPLDEPPPRDSGFGSPLLLSRVHWVRPELVVEVTYLTWTEDGLLRQVSYRGQREDKPANQVVWSAPKRSQS